MAWLFAFLHHAAAFPFLAAHAADAARLLELRRMVHFELAAVVVILLCAAVMARGIGSTT